MISEDDIESEIEYHRQSIRDTKSYLDELPPERHPIAYYGLGTDAKGLGLYLLLKGECDDAVAWLSDSTGFFLESVRQRRVHRAAIEKSYWSNEPYVLLDAMYAAILAGDKEGRQRAAAETLAMDSTYETEFPSTLPWYFFAKTLAAILDGDTEAQREYLAELNQARTTLDEEFEAFFRGLALTAEGLIEGDSALVDDGLDTRLTDHERDIRGSPTGVRELICVNATALAQLARERGLDIEIESEFIPGNIPSCTQE